MAATLFRLWFGSSPARMKSATMDQLEHVEEIVVDQEAGMIWEAKITMHTCLTADGVWQHRPEETVQPFQRVRVEVQAGGGDWLPLIHGPVVQFLNHLSSQPGQSVVQIVIRDDSVFLHREEKTETYEPVTDSALVKQLITAAGAPVQYQLDVVTPPDDIAQPAARQGTVMQCVRLLAQAHDFQACVLPPSDPQGISVACFKPKATKPLRLLKYPLTLLGEKRTISEFQVHANFESPGKSRGSALSFKDGRVASAEGMQSEADLLNKLPALPSKDEAKRQIHPAKVRGNDPAPQTKAEATRHSPVYEGSGSLIPGRYNAVLAPYEVVQIDAGATPQSGPWRIKKVRHKLTRSAYSQEFSAESAGQNEIAAAGSIPAAPAGIF